MRLVSLSCALMMICVQPALSEEVTDWIDHVTCGEALAVIDITPDTTGAAPRDAYHAGFLVGLILGFEAGAGSPFKGAILSPVIMEACKAAPQRSFWEVLNTTNWYD